MKFKKSLLSFIFAAVMLLSSACGQAPENVRPDISESVSESKDITESASDSAEGSNDGSSKTEAAEKTTEESSQEENETEITESTEAETQASDSEQTVSESESETVSVSESEAETLPPQTSSAADAASPETEESTVQTAATADETSAPSQEPISSGGFQVKGTSLYDANGNEFVMRGINHAHSWFQDQLETAIPAIAKTGANTVRVVLSDGQQWGRIPLDDVEKIIEICKENKLVCIVEVHDLTGKDDIEGLRKTVGYWLDIKSALIGNEAYVILNIANEWVGSWDNAEMWYQGYSEAIKTLREAGINNTLMIDAPGWGQFAKPIDDYGEALFNEDPNKNTMFSIHMYGAAGKSPRVISTNLQYAAKHGLCAAVGEFGYNHSDGDVDEEYIMEYCTDNGIGYLGWSWKGNGGGVEYLDIAKDWKGSELSEDWGDKLINGENGIKATSEICSVY